MTRRGGDKPNKSSNESGNATIFIAAKSEIIVGRRRLKPAMIAAEDEGLAMKPLPSAGSGEVKCSRLLICHVKISHRKWRYRRNINKAGL